jgi:pimeloyl-ACP methyl ester carboxylesterase
MEGLDATMAACILDLYRSAVDVGKEWAPDFVDIPKPGLVLIASEDPFLAVAQAKSAAARVGARVAPLDGVGHWWMLQDPVRSAAALREFWSSVS